EPFGEAQPVPSEPAGGVDGADGEARPDRQRIAAQVGVGAVLDEDVGVGAGQAGDAPRTMVLEAAAQQAHALRPQGAGQDVAVIAPVGGALEAKLNGPGAVDPLAVSGWQACGHLGESSNR